MENFKTQLLSPKSIEQNITQFKQLELNENLDFGNINQVVSGQEISLESLSDFGDLMAQTIDKAKFELTSNSSNSKGDFGKIKQISGTKFEVGGIGQTDSYEFDSTPTVQERADGTVIYEGTINGKKAIITSKNGKVSQVTYYNDNDKLDTEIKYGNSSKETTRYYSDGKTPTYKNTENLDGGYNRKWFDENGNLKEESIKETGNNARSIVKQYYENGQLKYESCDTLYAGLHETEYYEDGKIKSKKHTEEDGSIEYYGYHENGKPEMHYYKNSDGKITMHKYFTEDGKLLNLELNNGEVDLHNFYPPFCSEKYTSDGIEYNFVNGNKVVMYNDGSYSVTINGETKKYNEKGEPVK